MTDDDDNDNNDNNMTDDTEYDEPDPNVANHIQREFVSPATNLFAGAFATNVFLHFNDDRRAIPNEDIPNLTFTMVSLIAEIIQLYIDAGSERDITFEDQDLATAIFNAFKGWTTTDE